MGVEGVHMLGPLEPADDEVGHRRRQHFVGDLQQIACQDNRHQFVGRECPGEGDDDDQRRVHSLTDDGRPHCPGPEHAAFGDELQLRHGVRVGKLACPEGDETGNEDAWQKAEDRDERRLIMPLRIGGQGNDQGRDGIEQRCAEESQPDGSPRGGIAIDLGKDIAKDVRDGEEHHRAAGGERSDADDLLGKQVGYQKDYDEGGCQRVEVAKAMHGMRVSQVVGDFRFSFAIAQGLMLDSALTFHLRSTPLRRHTSWQMIAAKP